MNKKQYNSIWAGSLALLLLAGSCSKSDETAAPEPSDGRIVVRSAAAESRRGKRRKPANDKEKRWN